MPVEMLSSVAGYIPGGVNIGVVTGNQGSVAMIDTGLNETNAKKALKAIEHDLGRPVTRIVTTHAHADHFGANATVVKRTGAQSLGVRLWTRRSSGIRFCNPLCFLPAPIRFRLCGTGFSSLIPARSTGSSRIRRSSSKAYRLMVIPLVGHSPGQIGFLVDDSLYCADIVLPSSVLEKYRIPYLFSVDDHCESLNAAVDIECTVAVSGHGPVRTPVWGQRSN